MDFENQYIRTDKYVREKNIAKKLSKKKHSDISEDSYKQSKKNKYKRKCDNDDTYDY